MRARVTLTENFGSAYVRTSKPARVLTALQIAIPIETSVENRTENIDWPAISDLELCHFPFPGIRFRFPFSPYPPFSLFPGNVSAFFCKIHKLPVILCHFPQFRQNSVKFAAKNARFAERSAKFRKNPEISKKTCKITQKFALERCKGVTIL